MHILQSFSERGIEVHTSSAPLAEGSSTAPKRSHSGNLENPGPTKRARNAPIGHDGRIMPLPPELDDDVQCAYYAIELLRVSWKASHASGILLRGNQTALTTSTIHFLFW